MNRQQLLLIQLGEELAEVQKDISKALGFGLDSQYPQGSPTNAENIAQEFNEAIAVFSMLENTEGFVALPPVTTIRIQEEKINKVNKYLQHSISCGTLVEDKNEPFEYKMICPECQSKDINFTIKNKEDLISTSWEKGKGTPDKEFLEYYEYDFYYKVKVRKKHFVCTCQDCNHFWRQNTAFAEKLKKSI